MSRQLVSPLLAVAAAMGMFSLTACNTVEGAGEDIEQAGQAIDEAAEESNDGNPDTP